MLSDLISPTPPTLLRSPTAPGRPYPPDIVAAVRALIEHAGLSHREAAARSGLRADTVGRWARRFGWRRASVAGGVKVAGVALRGFAETGYRDVRHAEETPGIAPGASRSTHDGGASFETPAVRAPQDDEGGSYRPGIAPGVSRRTQDGGASFETPVPGFAGARAPQDDGRGSFPGAGPGAGRRPYRYGPEVVAVARVRVEGSRDGMERIALELGIARGTLVGWRKRFGWRRPAAPETGGPGFYRSRRFGRPYGGDAASTARDLVTGSTLPLGRIAARAGVSRATLYRWIQRRGWTRRGAARGRHRPPYGPEVVAAARELYETTNLSTMLVAARAGATRERVRHWARTGGWTRPRGRRDPYGGGLDRPYGCGGRRRARISADRPMAASRRMAAQGAPTQLA